MVEAFDGIIKFNPWLLSLDAILIVYFLFSWYRQYKKTNAYIDYWHFNLFLVFFIPILIMYPFSSSILNVWAVWGPSNLYTIEKATNEAYIVTIIGFTAAYLGKYIYDNFRPFTALEGIIVLFSSTLGRYFVAVTENSKVSRVFTISYIFLLLGFVIFIFLAGLVKNPREFFMLNPQYGPIYTFILSTFDVVFIMTSTRVLQYRANMDKFLLSTLILLGLFLGVRAPLILEGLSFGVLYVIYRKKGYVPIVKILGIVFATLILVMALAFIRNSSNGYDLNLDTALQSFLPEIFYGNTFSDIRDFSWVLGYWNREHYWGLSYLAAFLSFIPSSVYSIRDTYGIGKITVNTAGLDATTHPGLRMGMFGEMYLNFGIIGVIIFGFAWGYIQRRLDILTKKYADQGNVIKASSVIIYSAFISYLTVSAGFWGFYITIFLLVSLYLITRLRLSK
ncbi:O-antigen polymerase [Spirosoma flavum]|uniref:O-antigen polymerase n=1 Tax=Spirosoma flavum TaxID=2048557 RepID=A0ABW6AB39_9BACT